MFLKRRSGLLGGWDEGAAEHALGHDAGGKGTRGWRTHAYVGVTMIGVRIFSMAKHQHEGGKET
jgi:hypothetical protein